MCLFRFSFSRLSALALLSAIYIRGTYTGGLSTPSTLPSWNLPSHITSPYHYTLASIFNRRYGYKGSLSLYAIFALLLRYRIGKKGGLAFVLMGCFQYSFSDFQCQAISVFCLSIGILVKGLRNLCFFLVGFLLFEAVTTGALQFSTGYWLFCSLSACVLAGLSSVWGFALWEYFHMLW